MKKLRIVIGETTVLLPICDLCGLVVGDQAQHNGWHDYIKTRMGMAGLFGGR